MAIDLSIIDVFSAATPNSQQAIQSAIQSRFIPKGQPIFQDKDPVQQVCFLAKGYATLYKIGREGEKKVIFICGAGEMLNEVILQDNYASISAQALTDCMVYTIDSARFRQIMMEDYQVAEAVMASMAIKIRRLYHQLKNTPGSVNLNRQLRAKLWKLARDHGVPKAEGIEIDIDLSLSFLADMVGAKRETVSRQMKQLAAEGLICVSKKRIIIPDPEKLIDFMYKA